MSTSTVTKGKRDVKAKPDAVAAFDQAAAELAEAEKAHAESVGDENALAAQVVNLEQRIREGDTGSTLTSSSSCPHSGALQNYASRPLKPVSPRRRKGTALRRPDCSSPSSRRTPTMTNGNGSGPFGQPLARSQN